MVHKLDVSFELDPAVVAEGDVFEINLTIKNVGDTSFPGGKITQFRIEYSGDAVNYLTDSVLPEVPALSEGEVFTFSYDFNAIMEGLSWLLITVESNDDEETLLFQLENVESMPWKLPFLVRNKDNIVIINLLKEISEKLDRLGGMNID